MSDITESNVNYNHRTGYGFFSQKHKEMSKNWLRKPVFNPNGEQELAPTTYEDKYYVSAEVPRFIEVTTITSRPNLNSKCYRWDDCIPFGKIFMDSFIPSSRYHKLSEDDKKAIIKKYWPEQ